MKKFVFLLILISTLMFTTACVQEEHETVTSDQEQVSSEIREGTEELNNTEAQEVAEAKPVVKSEEIEGSKGFLWETQKGNTTVYLLGSIHVGTKDMYPLRKEILEAFNESDYLAVEVDVSNINTEEMQLFIEQNLMYTDGTTLKENLTPELYTQLDVALQSVRLRAEQFHQFKPEYILSMLESLLTREWGYEENLGIESYFLTKAADKMEILELENYLHNMNLIYDLAEKHQEKNLTSLTVENMEKAEKVGEQLMGIWIAGDLEGLETWVYNSDDGTKESEEMMKLMLDDRNIGMAEKIEGYLNTQEGKTYFVVAGAAHFVGDMSIINLLQEMGYEINEK